MHGRGLGSLLVDGTLVLLVMLCVEVRINCKFELMIG